MQVPDSILQMMDSVEVSLLTCSPGHEVWSLYGHTAIRLVDKMSHQDIAINYGVFSFQQKNFGIRFVFGINDYMMGEAPTALFLTEYQHEGRGIKEQVLNLTREDKLRFIRALQENERPENIFYRYNYFYDNCTTRARDIITKALTGRLEYTNKLDDRESFRSIIHKYNEEERWSRVGNDLLLGVNADKPTTREEQQFLPDNLMRDFAHATYDGRPLVKETRWLLEPGSTVDKEAEFPLSPMTCSIVVLVVTVLLTITEWLVKRRFWGFDLLMLLLTGLAGLVLLAMVFSQHPTVSLNYQIVVLNPLSLVFLYPVVKASREGRAHRYWDVLSSMILFFFILSNWQSYAEGMHLLALSLLVRSCRIFWPRRNK